jgi:hypothetical protein
MAQQEITLLVLTQVLSDQVIQEAIPSNVSMLLITTQPLIAVPKPWLSVNLLQRMRFSDVLEFRIILKTLSGMKNGYTIQDFMRV